MQFQPNPYQSPDDQSSPIGAAPPGYRDQTVWLIVFGIFQILIGCFCWLMAPMMLISAMAPRPGMPPGAAPEARMMIPAVIFYILVGIVFFLLGIGSIRCRRWARTLTVLLSWVWLITGVAGTIAFVFVAPKTLAAMQQAGKIPPPMLTMMLIFMGGTLTCIYILLPAAFLLVYQRASARATCERRDPQIRWTDRCPMPVLAISILLALCVVSMPLGAFNRFVTPFFGVFLSGAPGRQ